jgi:hypothetical protein
MYPTPEQLADWAADNAGNAEYLKAQIPKLKRYARTCPNDVAQRVLALVQAYERKLEEAAE